MNKKAEGYGGYLFTIIILFCFVYFGGNYIENRMYDDLFIKCEEHCINDLQEYYGIENIKDKNILCVCSEEKYNVYRSKLWSLKITNVLISNSSSPNGESYNCD